MSTVSKVSAFPELNKQTSSNISGSQNFKGCYETIPVRFPIGQIRRARVRIAFLAAAWVPGHLAKEGAAIGLHPSGSGPGRSALPSHFGGLLL